MDSNEKIIYESLIQTYSDFVQSMTVLSYSDAHDASVVSLEYKGLKFDSIHNCHSLCENLEKAPDGLFLSGDQLYFVEFKYGETKKVDIRSKIHEALVTLYHYVMKSISGFTREDFFSLNIKYAVIEKTIENCRPTFAKPLQGISKKYHLKNMEGFIIKETYVLYEKNIIEKFLIHLTGCTQAELIVA